MRVAPTLLLSWFFSLCRSRKCSDQTGCNKFRQSVARVESGVCVHCAFGGIANRSALQDGLTKRVLGGIEAVDLEFSAGATDFDPDIGGGPLKTGPAPGRAGRGS